MKAIQITADKTLEWNEVPDPVLEPGKVIIEIHAAGVNRADLLQREGNYPPPPDWPEWMGLEAAGIILEASDTSRWKTGDRVCALLGGGGYAEKVAVPEELVLPIPQGLSMTEAAALPEVFATAYLNLCLEGEMQAGDNVFIQAGASGVGIAAIQLAKMTGATIITTVGSEEKAAFVKDLGADVIINRKTEDIAAVLKEHQPDIALDCVAGPNLGPCLETMARGGRWIIIATLGGTASELNMLDFFKRGVKLIGSTLRSRSSETKGQILQELESTLWEPISSETIKPVIYKSFPIEEAELAHAILERNENIGKVILTVKGA